MATTKTFHIETLGCRANQADSAVLQRRLQEGNCVPAPADIADLVVVNTCTVTHRADQDSRQAIRRVRRRNPRARLLVTGCYAQRAPLEVARLQGVEWVVACACREQIPGLVAIENPVRDRCAVVYQDPAWEQVPFETAPAAMVGRTRPFLKIQDGCDARCSYCVVPFVRGAARSAHPEVVLRQVRQLIAEGHQEIVLTGIHLGTFGKKLARPTSLARLLGEIAGLPGLGRLRLSCIEPMRFSRALLTLVESHPVLAPHFHIPLQSGASRTLARMRRPYRPAHYAGLVAEIRSRLPDAAIGTDVIVGFPGETQAEHRESLRFVEQSPISHVHVFSYSSRSGTAAAAWPELPPEVVAARSGEFRALAHVKRLDFERRFVGRTFRALTLEAAPGAAGTQALTANYLQVVLPGVDLPNNRWVDVTITKATRGGVRGELTTRAVSPGW